MGVTRWEVAASNMSGMQSLYILHAPPLTVLQFDLLKGITSHVALYGSGYGYGHGSGYGSGYDLYMDLGIDLDMDLDMGQAMDQDMDLDMVRLLI